jgi:methylmalonyl-CoA/ethylmalonyl-CoA epimerase
MTTVTGVDHIAIAVPNLDEALPVWEKMLGVRCDHVEELPARGIRVAFLPVGHTRIELVAPLHDKSEISKFLTERGGGIHHIAVATKNVDADITALKADGVRIAQDPAPGAHGCRVAFVHPKATGGVLLEFTTLPD